MAIALRKAELDDRPALMDLIALSARRLCRQDYTDEQIEAALGTVFGVDTDLIRDGSYFVAEEDERIVGCGGWSRRKTLFGGDQYAGREPELLDPRCDAARIRAFFVHPDWARQGIGRALLQRCESEARARGFRSAELMATLPGVRFYRALGYSGEERLEFRLGDSIPIEFVPMRKALA